MINDDIRPVQASNLVVKIAHDIYLGLMVTDDCDASYMETNNIKIWAETNRMKLNIKKTWEIRWSYAAKYPGHFLGLCL